MSCSRDPYQLFDNNELTPPFSRPTVLGTLFRILTVAWQGMFQKDPRRWKLRGWAAYEPKKKQTPGTNFSDNQWTYHIRPEFPAWSAEAEGKGRGGERALLQVGDEEAVGESRQPYAGNRSFEWTVPWV